MLVINLRAIFTLGPLLALLIAAGPEAIIMVINALIAIGPIKFIGIGLLIGWTFGLFLGRGWAIEGMRRNEMDRVNKTAEERRARWL